MYMAKMLIWHSVEEQYVQPGEDVDLSHLSKEEIQALIENEIIEEVNDGSGDDADVI